MKQQILSIYLLMQFFKLIYCGRYNETLEVLPLRTVFFFGEFNQFEKYEEHFKYLGNTISIVADSLSTISSRSEARRDDFKLRIIEKYNHLFEIVAFEEHLDKYFMYQRSLNLTFKSKIEDELRSKEAENEFQRKQFQKISLKVNSLQESFNLVLLSFTYERDIESKKSQLLQELYNATNKVISELKQPTIIILSDLFVIFPNWLETSFNSSGSNWKICSEDDPISAFHRAIMFYAHSIPPNFLDVNLIDCQNLKDAQLAQVIVTYQIEKTATASTTLKTTTKVSTSASTKSTNKSTATKSKTTSSFSTVSSTTITQIILNTKTATLTSNEQFEYRDNVESNMSKILVNDEFDDDYINDEKCKKIKEIEGIRNASCVETANVIKVAFGIITCFFLFYD